MTDKNQDQVLQLLLSCCQEVQPSYRLSIWAVTSSQPIFPRFVAYCHISSNLVVYCYILAYIVKSRRKIVMTMGTLGSCPYLNLIMLFFVQPEIFLTVLNLLAFP